MNTLAQAGFSAEQARAQLDQIVQSQSLMLATNQVFMVMAALFVTAGLVIWLAPKAARTVDTSAVH